MPYDRRLPDRHGGCWTGGYDLAANYVIHTAGPVWQGGGKNEEQLLANCYRSVLAIAAKNRLRKAAFPSISTGIYGFPIKRASRIAVREVAAFLAANELPAEITFCCFGAADTDTYRDALAEARERV